MTTNQITYWDNIERARHNEETERQARRSEIANDLRQKEKLTTEAALKSQDIAARLTEAMMKSPGLLGKFINAFPALGASIGAAADIAGYNSNLADIDAKQQALHSGANGDSTTPVTYGRRINGGSSNGR